MKSKILYAALAVLIILILVNLLISRKSASIQPIPEPEPEVAADNTQQPVDVIDIKRPAVTLIKSSPNRITASSAQEARSETAKKQQQETPPAHSEAGQNSATPGRNPAEAAASVTKTNNRPSKEEVKEMNSNGVMIY